MKLLRLAPVIVAISCLAATVVACGDEDERPPPTPAPTATAAPLTVAMSLMDNSFAPNALTARAGQQVTVNLTSAGQRPHTFTIDNLVDSGRITAGATGSVQFTTAQAGTLTFYCTVHGRDNMNGTLTVSAAALDAPQTLQDVLAVAD